MNGLDWVLLALLALAAGRGFFRGFVVEIASLVAVVLGIWVAVHYNAQVAAWIGLDAHREVISFIITFIGVLILVHLLAKVITKAMDMAMLGLPNKVAGTLFGAVRAAFILSVALNILMVRPGVFGSLSQKALDGSKLYRPIRAFAPFLIPALGESRWVQEAIDAVRGRQQAASTDEHYSSTFLKKDSSIRRFPRMIHGNELATTRPVFAFLTSIAAYSPPGMNSA